MGSAPLGASASPLAARVNGDSMLRSWTGRGGHPNAANAGHIMTCLERVHDYLSLCIVGFPSRFGSRGQPRIRSK